MPPFPLPYAGTTPQSQRIAEPVVILDTNGDYLDPAGKKSYRLALNGILSTATSIRGGDYAWSIEGTASSDAVYRLMTTGPSGTTFYPMKVPGTTNDATLTLNSTTPLAVRGMGLGQDASVKIELVSGTAPANISSSVAGL